MASRGQQIIIDGVTDRSTYTDIVSFRVQTNAGFIYQVTLNGLPMPAGTFNAVSTMDYYDLATRRTQLSDNSVTNTLVRFIVLSSERGNPEKGLIKWTPYPIINSTAAEFAGARLNIVTPQNYPQGLEIPVVAWVDDASGQERRANGVVTASGFESSAFQVRRGVGFGFLPSRNTGGAVSYNAHLTTLQSSKAINIDSATTWTSVSGVLPGSANWPDDSRIFITANLTVPAGATLTIGAGTVVRLNPAVNVTNIGRILINGTTTQPVVFTATNRVAPEQHTGAWGGFIMRTPGAELTANGAIMTGAGAAANFGWPGYASSHKTEQALLMIHSNSVARLTNCYFINNAGQIGNGFNSDLTLDHCLWQRAITAGEYAGGTIIVNHSAVIEFPADDGVVNAAIADLDYDGLYFTLGTHILQNSLFGFSKDDAIDSGSGGAGTVVVSNCWVEGSLHEALAWSGQGRQTWTYDSVLMNCGQGIEAGWTIGSATDTGNVTPASPDCVAERLLSTGNSVGARFGDNYDWGYRGFLRITNSFLLNNYRDIFAKTWNTVGVAWDTNRWIDRLLQMDLRGNFFTAANTNHPNNSVWDPAADGWRLGHFMTTPANAPVGIGLANRTQLTLASLTEGVPVRLSSFTTNFVSVNYAVEIPGSVLTNGTLTFAPGETVKKLYCSPTGAQGQQLVRVSLSAPVAGELTGTSQTYIINATAGTNTTLIPFGASWKYLDDGSNQGTAWRAPGFSDAGWSNGLAQLGFGDLDESTMIRSNRNNIPSDRIATYYFRKTITMADPTQFGSFSMRLLRDDAGIVYFNGREVLRSPNMPAGNVTYDQVTGGTAPPDNTIDTTNIVNSLNLFSNGANVIACEIHQQALSSSDISFDLELIGLPAAHLSVGRFGNQLVFDWSDASYLLEEADEVTGPWGPGSTGVSSPVSVTPSQARKFYRLRKQ